MRASERKRRERGGGREEGREGGRGRLEKGEREREERGEREREEREGKKVFFFLLRIAQTVGF